MVDEPSKYVWSSYRCNGLGKSSELHAEHPEYTHLGMTPEIRQEAYRALFATHVEGELLTELRDITNKGLVLGSEKFKDEVECNLLRKARPGAVGRPKQFNTNHGTRQST
jgi:putative transposase